MTDYLLSDLSAYQPDVDTQAYVDGGRRAVILKATEGDSYVSEVFADQRAAFEAQPGIVGIGIYHYAHATTVADVVAQAQHFIATVGDMPAGQRPLLDAEEAGLTDEEVDAWKAACESAWPGSRPDLYRSLDFEILDDGTTGEPAEWQDPAAWVASWSGVDPRPLVPGCQLWQYTNRARVPGVHVENVDDSVFTGTLEELAAFFNGSPAVDPQPPEPTNTQEENDMLMFNHQDGVSLALGGGVCIDLSGDPNPGLDGKTQVESLLEAKVPSIGDATDDQARKLGKVFTTNPIVPPPGLATERDDTARMTAAIESPGFPPGSVAVPAGTFPSLTFPAPVPGAADQSEPF